jgi:copper resistance protein B
MFKKKLVLFFIPIFFLYFAQSLSAKETGILYGIQIEQLEHAYTDNNGEVLRWDGKAFVGTDELKFKWFSSGEENTKSGKTEKFENRFMLSKPLSTFFDVKAGLRFDIPRGEDRAYAVLGFTGLAPQWIEVDTDFFISESNKTSVKIDAEYELLITNYLILRPSLDVKYAFEQDRSINVGKGLNSMELGLRLSYDLIDRTLSPYIGVSWEKKFGDTSNFVRDEGEETKVLNFVIGTRFMF